MRVPPSGWLDVPAHRRETAAHIASERSETRILVATGAEMRGAMGVEGKPQLLSS